MEERVTIGEAFLNLNLDKSVKIIDIACGIGNVAAELVAEGYENIDGLDPIKGYLEVAKQRKLYQQYFRLSVDPGQNLPIDNDTYDVVICCAGFFDGLMSPQVFPELIRITKPKGILMWNIAEGYEEINKELSKFDQIIDQLRGSKKWDYYQPIQTFNRLVFSDGGASFLKGLSENGLDGKGFIYTMIKL